jgi:hypothetical protein
MKPGPFLLLAVAGPITAMLAASASGAADTETKVDRGKEVIESPSKRLVAGKSGNVAVTAEPFVNPKVAPGKVHWHGDFAQACQAATKSHKPVLLFQMMGRLDEKFC